MIIDASAAVALCLSEAGWSQIEQPMQAPALLRSEVLSAIQGLQWRREVSSDLAEHGVAQLLAGDIRLVRSKALYREARCLALRFGWKKTYDAEYVALALITGEPLLTVDARLSRRVSEIVEVTTPADL